MGETNGQMNHWKKERGTTLILRINASSSYQKTYPKSIICYVNGKTWSRKIKLESVLTHD